MTSSRRRFDVYEFNEEDEGVQSASERFLVRFGKPKSDDAPITKYTFLECFAQDFKPQRKERTDKPIDVDTTVMGHQCTTSVSHGRVVLLEDSTCHNYLDSGSIFPESNSFSAGALNLGVTSAGSKPVDSTLTLSLSDNEPIDMISDSDESIGMSSSSTSVSDLGENEGPLDEPVPECGIGAWEIDNVNMTVVVSPDFIMYGDIYCTESLLTFSCCTIKLEGSIVNGSKRKFSFEWTIDDIVNIESQWCGRVETAIINLHLKSKDTEGAGNASETSGVEVLKFAVYDPHWSEGQEAIKSLDVRYKDIWNVIFDIDAVSEEDAFLGQHTIDSSKNYFSNSDQPFEDLIYPKGDPDAVSISLRDVELLQPETFINDTIIDFYIKYLKNKIQPEERHRFYFFNSFFFRKLADLDKDPSSGCEGRAAFQRVRKWTRKVNLFEKDYIFIPVNFSLHWSLIVICYPGEVANFKDEQIDKSLKVPCILHMDSFKGSHKGLKNLVQSYLWEEWRERQNETAEDVCSKFFNLRFVPLELPQQENSFDCGLFLLHYAELFLEEAPVNFSPFNITKFSNFLNRDWFLPTEASLKRAHIQKLIYELLEDSSQKVSPTDGNVKYPSSQSADPNEQETDVELFEEVCSSTKTCHDNASSFNAVPDMEITLLSASPSRGIQCIRESGFSLREFEPGAVAGSLPDELHQRSIMSPIEEVEEAEERIVHSSSDKANHQQVPGIVTETPEISCFVKDFRALKTSWNPGITMHLEEPEDRDSSFGTSISGSQNSSDVELAENPPLKEVVGLNRETDQPESSSTLSEGLAACTVEDSEEASGRHDGNESEDSLSSCQGNIVALSHKAATSTDNIDLTAENMPLSSDDPVSEACEQPAAKRQRLMPPKGGRRLTRSLSKDLHL
ncbi:hypothetical protein L1049_015317 [Liquidambar formosana]|uniref:Ubiquitin-like protease family profile domain-containing protein n=1 Tax=Liquidambar formosana TaxID=63359 RepID=A0AAP0S4P0_LIQFO